VSISIRTNINAVNTARQLGSAQEKVDLTMQKLSTGLRVNKAADDAAGLAISEKLKAQINGLNQAARNAKDAISLVQTAEGALGELGNMLQRMRTLALQAVNDVNTVGERASIQKEVSQLQTEITRLSQAAEFNGQKLLDGSFQSRRFQVGANTGQEITLSMGGVDATRLGMNRITSNVGAGTMSEAEPVTAAGTTTANNLAAQTLTVTGSTGNATVAVTAGQSARAVAEAVNLQSSATAVTARAETALRFTLAASATPVNVSFTLAGDKLGAQTTVANITERATISTQVESSSDLTALAQAINDQTAKTGIQARIGDTKSELIIIADDGRDIVISGFTGSNGAQVNATIQGLGANTTETTPGVAYVNSGGALTLNGNSTEATRVGGFLKFDSASSSSVVTTAGGTLLTATTTNSTLFDIANINVSDVDGASGAISLLDGAIQQVNDLRATLGATQNRLQSTIANLESTSENLQFSNARIRDADVAMESSELARAQVLMQAGISVLSQANQQPQMALKLLGG
jgi:flagellin